MKTRLLPYLYESVFLLIYVCVLAAIMYPWSMYGFNMQDEGWVLTAYQNIFSHPQDVSYNFLYYNSMLVGGVWEYLFGEYGLVAFRVLRIIVEVLKALIVYFLLRRYCNKWIIFAGYFLLLMRSTNIVYPYYDHNQLTSLLSLLAIFLLMKGFENKEKAIPFISAGGMVIGLNIFTRLPNITLLSLFVTIALFYFLSRDKRRSWQLVIAFVGGVSLGCFVECILMGCLGHWSVFIDNISSGFAASADADSTHNLSSMAGLYGFQLYRWIWFRVCSLIVCGLLLLCLKRVITNKYLYISVVVLLAVLYFIFARQMVKEDWNDYLYAISTIMLVYAIVYLPDEYKYLSLMSLLMLYMIPLGSDWGYGSNIIHLAASLSLPLALCCLAKAWQTQSINHKIFILPICVCLFCVIGTAPVRFTLEAYNKYKDLINTATDYPVHSPLATTRNNNASFSEDLNPLLDTLSEYVKPGDKILCFQSLAMVHYLTQTRPYLENAWPWTYTSTDMERHFQKAMAESTNLPVIVREKSWVANGWRSPYKDWDNSNAVENRYHKNKKIKLIQDFIKDNSYLVVWENDLFQIIVPPKDK